MTRIATLLALLLLAGCGDVSSQQGRAPSYHHSFTNGTDAAGFVPPNSLPR